MKNNEDRKADRKEARNEWKKLARKHMFCWKI